MASGEGKPSTNAGAGAGVTKGRKRKYLPHGKPVRKGGYPLRPGVQGFFITCDGGRERQASREALSLLDSFYEDLVDGTGSGQKSKSVPDKPMNKKIKFEDSDSSDDDDDHTGEVLGTSVIASKDNEDQADTADESKPKKLCVEDPPISEQTELKESTDKPTESTDKPKGSNDKPIDDLIDEDLKELGDRKKRLFATLDSGCNGCIFIQMNKRDGDPGPVEVVQNMMSSVASTRKHMSRFILRVLPTEVACYASEEEITKAISPLVEKYFPKESSLVYKFAVLYEARSNTGIDRMKIINAVAKSVPQPHKVDLNNPDRTIIVQIAKTICMIGVVERYKELSKFNLRQLTSPPHFPPLLLLFHRRPSQLPLLFIAGEISIDRLMSW
ncbi:hypothetical protein GUJ93_ZPchr0011g27228 [Zizania palustris]|uniref:THUMP domain-containing protein n=1 Tax=Zizania palustris TaxID=103762 RepID=A0A8J6BQ99_ZIZPA|nr:hypothetical protein GUJ93_ZPchr0011g27228 [Zizania palustris]